MASSPAVYMVQFVTPQNFSIPGAGAVTERGYVLEIGAGRLGENFPYRSPREQVRHYGHQAYVLIAAYDEFGNQVPHPDLNVALDDTPSFIDAKEIPEAPVSGHREAFERISTGDKASRVEKSTEEKPKKKRTSTKKSSTKKSSTTKKKRSKKSEE